ncbi:hypothetical protein B0H13DRAFT_1935379 [Mycena leptocephala]|nr:hypothetical protein B0H13DRAFT_1935379 [Mycena leptocephala]
MPPPERKDCVSFIGIHKKEFEAKLEALIDELPTLPVAQSHFLKVEMMFQNDLLEDHIAAFGIPPTEPLVIVTAQTETVEDFVAAKVLTHPDAQKIIKRGKKEFGMHIGARAFSVDVVPKIDSPAGQSGVHLMGVYTVPDHLATAQHEQKFHALVDDFVAFPIIQKNLMKYEMWLQNNSVDDLIRTFDYAAPSPIFVLRGECESWDKTLKMMRDPQAQRMLLDAGKDFDFTIGRSLFSMDVVTKIHKQ